MVPISEVTVHVARHLGSHQISRCALGCPIAGYTRSIKIPTIRSKLANHPKKTIGLQCPRAARLLVVSEVRADQRLGSSLLNFTR